MSIESELYVKELLRKRRDRIARHRDYYQMSREEFSAKMRVRRLAETAKPAEEGPGSTMTHR